MGPISVCYLFGEPFGRGTTIAGFRADSRSESAVRPCA